MDFDQFEKHFELLRPQQQAGFCVWPSLLGNEITAGEEEILKEFQPSGMVLFKRNCKSLQSIFQLTNSLKKILQKNVNVAVDEEGGRVCRLPFPVPRGLPAWQLGNMHSQESLASIYDQCFMQASILKSVGCSVVFSPVADVLSVENNPAMSERCYSRESATVANCVIEASRGYKDGGILPCVKHFPGHGNTHQDSHEDFAESNASLDVLRLREWPPFSNAFRNGVNLCMTAHVKLECLDAKYPATLSKTILQNYLRKELKFQGVIFSDDLRMNAIAKHYGVNQGKVSSILLSVGGNVAAENSGYLGIAACDALLAGCNVIVCSQSILREKETLQAVAERAKTSREFRKVLCDSAFLVHKNLPCEPL